MYVLSRLSLLMDRQTLWQKCLFAHYPHSVLTRARAHTPFTDILGLGTDVARVMAPAQAETGQGWAETQGGGCERMDGDRVAIKEDQPGALRACLGGARGGQG